MGRFINADAFTSTGQGLLGNNMFAYCGNNPIIYKDDAGQFPWLIVGIIAICTIGGGVLGYLSDERLGVISNEQDDIAKAILPHKNSETLKKENSDTAQRTEEDTLTVGDRIKNTLIGASLGFGIGGAVVATGGAAGSVAVGSATTYIAAFGGTGAQTFAIGALAYDLFAMVVAPFFGVEMETIEIEP